MRRTISHICLVVACVVAVMAITGCVRRTLSITSDPTGALVHLNGREIGRTPLEIDFVHYGVYDVVLEQDGYESLLTSGTAEAPLWDNVPFDFFAELIPGEHRSEIAWHYVLLPRNDDPATLVDRARILRDRLEAAPHPETLPTTLPAATQPDDHKHKKPK